MWHDVTVSLTISEYEALRCLQRRTLATAQGHEKRLWWFGGGVEEGPEGDESLHLSSQSLHVSNAWCQVQRIFFFPKINGGYPKWMVYSGKSYKILRTTMDDLGVPHISDETSWLNLPHWPGPICSAGRSHHEASSQLQPFLGAIQLFLVFFFGTRGIEDRVSNDSCTVLRELFMASWLDRVIDKGLILTCFNTSTSTGGWSKQFLFVHSLPPCNTWFSIFLQLVWHKVWQYLTQS